MSRIPTKRNIEAYDCIIQYWQEHNCSPSVRDIRDMMGYKTESAPHRHIKQLRDIGLLIDTPRGVVPFYFEWQSDFLSGWNLSQFELIKTFIDMLDRANDLINTFSDSTRYLMGALKEIAKREGAFSRDRLQHANNVIENMGGIAERALDGTWKAPGSDGDE